MDRLSAPGFEVIHEDVVGKALAKMKPKEKYMRLAALFKTFGDCTRLQLLHALEHNEMCVGDLAALLGLTKSAVSHQLKALSLAELVCSRREAQVVYYSLAANEADPDTASAFPSSVVSLINSELASAGEKNTEGMDDGALPEPKAVPGADILTDDAENEKNLTKKAGQLKKRAMLCVLIIAALRLVLLVLAAADILDFWIPVIFDAAVLLLAAFFIYIRVRRLRTRIHTQTMPDGRGIFSSDKAF